MTDKWLEALDIWRKSQHSNAQKANAYLKYLLKHTLENSAGADASTLDGWRYGLEQTLHNKLPQDWDSYNLGIAKSIIYFLQFQTSEKMNSYNVETLQPLEKKIMSRLAQSPRRTPTQLMDELVISRQQASNLLRSLRLKSMVDYIEIGKNRWYSLTAIGHTAYERFKGHGESSASSNMFAGIPERKNNTKHTSRNSSARLESKPVKKDDPIHNYIFLYNFEADLIKSSDEHHQHESPRTKHRTLQEAY